MSNNKAQMTNQVQNSNKRIYDLEERTAKLGESIIRFVKSLPNNAINQTLIRQLVRSGTSIGANYMEADAADSKKYLRYKIALCKKEAKETTYWFQMVVPASPDKDKKCEGLKKEAHELVLIFYAILIKK